MLKQLKIENFTVFPKADFEFAPGLNVIVGENGTGKSHVLKLVYSVLAAGYKESKFTNLPTFRPARLGNLIGEKLKNVFCSDINGLKSKQAQKKSSESWQALLQFATADLNIEFKNPVTSNNRINIIKMPSMLTKNNAVFIQTRELLTIYPGFVSLYEGRYLEFDETYRDTCLLLGEPLLKNPMTELLAILEEAMNGKVLLENGRFYLVSDLGKIEMPLVAEGIRKLAMLAQLIAVGALQKGGYLFWDEPEANLNPRLIKIVARVIWQLAKVGVQIFIATHSLFLLRELEILQATEKKPVPQRYFALKKTDGGVNVEQGNSIDNLQTLVLLDEELQQSDRYMAIE